MDFEMNEKQSKSFSEWIQKTDVIPQYSDIRTLNLCSTEEKILLEKLFKRQNKFDALKNFKNTKNEKYNYELDKDSQFISFINLSKHEQEYKDQNLISEVIQKCKTDKDFIVKEALLDDPDSSFFLLKEFKC